MSAGTELQTAVYAALIADTDLMSEVSGVFDAVPDNYDSFPYVTIGEDVLNEFDTDTTNGHNVSLTIHTWTRKAGRKQAKTIQGLIYDTLHNSTLVMTGYIMILMRQIDETTLMDPDGKTRHGVQTFNAILFKTS